MKALIFILAILNAWAASAQLAEAPRVPELTVTVTPATTFETNGYVQGQIVLRIRLLSRYPFDELTFTSPQFETADVNQLLRPRTRKIDGYAGQGYSYETALAVTPRQPGVLIIPPFTAEGAVSPEKDKELRFDLASKSMELEVADVPAAYDGDWWLAATRAEADETWSTPVDNIRVGEVVQRKVSLRVWGVTAEHLPELTHPPAQNVRISLRSADTRTEVSPEGLVAHASYVWDIEVDRQQVVFLKPIGVKFWNVSRHEQQSATVPAHRLEPLPADSAATAAALMQEAIDAKDETGMFATLAAIGLAAPGLVLVASFLVSCMPSRADIRLQKICKAETDPGKIYNAVDYWLTASRVKKTDLEHRLPARRELSDQLFSRTHPSGDLRPKLLRQAFALSRRERLSTMVHRLRIPQ